MSSDTDSTAGPVTKKPSKKKYVQLPVSVMVLRPPPRKTEYTPVEEKIRTIGQGFGIFHEMWHLYSTIIEKGLEASAADPSALPEVYVFPILSPHTDSYHSKQGPSIYQ